jgi:hypothetical protein
MTSFIDGIFGSDAPNPSTPASSGLPQARRRTDRSSSRPRGPPSESNGAPSDIDGFHDDEIVGARGTVGRPRGPAGEISKVVDRLGEALVGIFETFLERCVYPYSGRGRCAELKQLYGRTFAFWSPDLECHEHRQILHSSNSRTSNVRPLHPLR